MDETLLDEDGNPRVPGINWAMALSVSIIRVLEKRDPGFRDAVRTEIDQSADRMERSDDPYVQADAPSVRALSASWIFTDPSSAAADD